MSRMSSPQPNFPDDRHSPCASAGQQFNIAAAISKLRDQQRDILKRVDEEQRREKSNPLAKLRSSIAVP